MTKKEVIEYLVALLAATYSPKEFCIGETKKVREALEIAIKTLQENK